MDNTGKIYLETDRLTLRQFTEADVDILHDIDSDPEVMRYINGGTPTSYESFRDDILPGWMRHYQEEAGLGFWAAIEKASGEFVGWFHFRLAPDGSDDVELGYRLKRSAWGKGYATEGARALVRKGFLELGVKRVIAHALVGNTASIRVLEKAGLKFEREYEEMRFPGPDKRAVRHVLARNDYDINSVA